MTSSAPIGLLNIDKPADMTSRQVVDVVQRLVQPAKAGHAGTLDPLATGVLVVCVGRATRLIEFVQQQRKSYRATFRLGCRSDTDDVTGQVVPVPDAPPVSRPDLEALLPEFMGEIKQVPPQFSAVHVDGRRAHQRARQGERVEIAPRTVTIHRLELLAFDTPEFSLKIECGSGTYVRSIGRDLGELLGCGAVMTELVRTRIGVFRLEEALSLESLTPEMLAANLLPTRTAVAHLSQVVCTVAQLDSVRHGRAIAWEPAATDDTSRLIALLTPDGSLAALAEYIPTHHSLRPRQVMPLGDVSSDRQRLS